MSEHQYVKLLKTTDRPTKQKAHMKQPLSQHTHPATIIQRARAGSLTHADALHLQRTIGNRAAAQLMSEIGGRSSAQNIPIQRQGLEEEEELLQGKAAGECLQCQEPEEEELQMKVDPAVIQRQEPEEEELLQGKMTETIQRQLEPGEEELQMQPMERMIKSGALQAKLKIGQPGDRYEQEANRVAELVMSMPEPKISRQEEDKEEEVQAKPLTESITPLVHRESVPEEEEETAQAKGDGGSSPAVPPSVESGINTIQGGGSPLPESSRAFFEPRFSADFSGVKVHTDSNAAHLARNVNAKAFTVGRDVVFGSGQFSPETTGGKKLLAHELTHVVQQKHVLFKKHSNKTTSYIPLLKYYIRNNNKNIQMKWYDYLPSPTGIIIRSIINKIVDKWIPRNDPGRWFGQSLIEHYAFGMKRPYIRKDGAWGAFMKKRPELKNGLNKKLKSIVKSLCMGSSDKGKVSDTLTGVKLHKLASMRMTLHGCHHIDIKGDFITEGRTQCPCYVNFNNLRFTWVDRGDLHPGTKTELDDGKVVDDSWFKKLAKYVPTAGPYDIRITWSADSKWLDDGVNMNCLYGWPSNTPAPTEKRKRR